MKKLADRDGGKFLTSPKYFSILGTFSKEVVEEVFDFAYDMTYGAVGEHRDHRSGGTHKRRESEKFVDTFQGKLGEFAVYNQLVATHRINRPDLSKYKLGKWDDDDFIIDGLKVTVKSTKWFGNLLLLETKDWNADGNYIPNLEKGGGVYEHIIFTRIKPACAKPLTSRRALYLDTPLPNLKEIMLAENWQYDIPGYITHEELKEVIREKQIIFKGQLLNGGTKMDADNYYVQAGDMHPINTL